MPIVFDNVTIDNVTIAETIVTANLQLHLDATNLASYPGTGNVWYDLSGNDFHGTINGNWTYETSPHITLKTDFANATIKCNGTALGSNAATPANLNVDGAKPKTVCVLVENPGSYTNQVGIWELGEYSPTAAYIFRRVSPGATQAWMANLWGTGNDFTFVYLPGEWNLWTMVYDGTTVTVYRRNAIVMASEVLTLNTATTGTFNLNRYVSDSLGMRGPYSQALIYDRALSTDEITQNWNALKGKVGL
jgi:hypothetical protein